MLLAKRLGELNIQTNFDKEKINTLFSNISTLNLLELFDLKKDYENLGYSSNEITQHLLNYFQLLFLHNFNIVISNNNVQYE